MSVPVSFRWDEKFVARLDAARHTSLGAVSRSAFVRDAVELAIRRAEHANAMAVDADGLYARQAVERVAEQLRKPSEDPDRHRADYTLPPPEQSQRPSTASSEVELEAFRKITESPPTHVPRVRSSAAARPFRPAPKGKA